MQPFLIPTMIKILSGLKRTCPKCQKSQVAPISKKSQIVRCKFCGENIPPQRKKA